MMGAIDTRKMLNNFAVNKHLHIVASRWILLIQSRDARNHEYKMQCMELPPLCPACLIKYRKKFAFTCCFSSLIIIHNSVILLPYSVSSQFRKVLGIGFMYASHCIAQCKVFFRRFREIVKSYCQLRHACPSIRQSVRKEQLGPTGRIFMKSDI